jgi:hypothetical protein
MMTNRQDVKEKGVDLQLFKVVGGDDRVLGLQATSAVHLSEDFFREGLLADRDQGQDRKQNKTATGTVMSTG